VVYERQSSKAQRSQNAATGTLFHNLEHRALAMARCRTGEQSANGVNGLARPANHTAYISASELQFKGDHSAIGNFREHHVIRKFYQFANDELEKFSHP